MNLILLPVHPPQDQISPLDRYSLILGHTIKNTKVMESSYYSKFLLLMHIVSAYTMVIPKQPVYSILSKKNQLKLKFTSFSLKVVVPAGDNSIKALTLEGYLAPYYAAKYPPKECPKRKKYSSPKAFLISSND
jgi:hypothetical protein